MGLLEKAAKISGDKTSLKDKYEAGTHVRPDRLGEKEKFADTEEEGEEGGLLDRAESFLENIPEEETEKEIGLIKKAEIVMEGSGKSQLREELEGKIRSAEEETPGLLEKAEEFVSKETTGLLEKAKELVGKAEGEDFPETYTGSEEKREKESGLLKRAEEMKEKKNFGLLRKAEELIGGAGERDYPETYAEKVEKTEEEAYEETPTVDEAMATGLGEKEEGKGEESIFSEELFSVEEIIEKERSKIEKEIAEKTKEELEEEKYEKEESQEKVFEEEPSTEVKEIEETDYFSMLKKSLSSEDTNGLILNMDRIISDEGFAKLGELVLDILVSMSGGEAGAIFTIFTKDDRIFAPSIFSSGMDKALKKKYKIFSTKIKKNEKFTSILIDSDGAVLSKDRKSEKISEAVREIKNLKNWMVVPFVSHSVIYGFALVVDVNDKKRIPRKQINNLMVIFRDKLAMEVLENRLLEIENELKLSEENQRLLSTIRKNLIEGKIERRSDIEVIFRNFCNELSIDIASLVVKMDRSFRDEIIAVNGVSQESLIRYDVSKIRSKINGYIKKNKVVFVKDIKPTQFGLVGEDAKKADTLVLVPILFNGEALGVLIIHKFTHKVKKLNAGLSLKLFNSSGYLLPLLLGYILGNLHPIDIAAKDLEGVVKWSGRSKKRLIFMNVKLDGMNDVIQKTGLRKSTALLAEIKRSIKEIENKNVEEIFIFPDIFTIIIKEGALEVETFKNDLQENIRELLKKQRSFKDLRINITFSSYPDRLKNYSDIFNFLRGKK